MSVIKKYSNNYMGGRPFMKSLIHPKEVFFLDRYMLKSIKYNNTLFKAYRRYYTDYGWIALIQFYVSFSYTFEKYFGLLGFSERLLNDMRSYVKEYNSFLHSRKLNDDDIFWFRFSTATLTYYFRHMKEVMRMDATP